MAATETITSVQGDRYNAVWLTCQVGRTAGTDEFLVRVNAPTYELPLPFYVQAALVEAPDIETAKTADGWVKVILVEQHEDETSTVKVLGEPISFGPNIRVPDSFLR
ncbi:MAG: hypothetical protein M3321_12980 [Actinomycetota bacterium]|nr:hypothetical protein [Actinomycetota bacterium]